MLEASESSDSNCSQCSKELFFAGNTRSLLSHFRKFSVDDGFHISTSCLMGWVPKNVFKLKMNSVTFAAKSVKKRLYEK